MTRTLTTTMSGWYPAVMFGRDILANCPEVTRVVITTWAGEILEILERA